VVRNDRSRQTFVSDHAVFDGVTEIDQHLKNWSLNFGFWSLIKMCLVL
jgi:hypothetical protein